MIRPNRKCLHQTAALVTGFAGNFEGRLGQIDHHPVRIREREDGEIDLRFKSTTKRVCLSSPPMRTSVATVGDSPCAASARRPRRSQGRTAAGRVLRRSARSVLQSRVVPRIPTLLRAFLTH